MAERRLLAVSPNLPCAMDRQEWSLEDYYIGKTLYSGYAAQVYTATCKYSGMEVVLKVYHDVDKAPDVAQHEMYREVAIQSGLQHPNVVHLFGAFEEGDTLVLVQEYVPNGDLLALMQSHGGRIDEPTVVKAVLRPLLGALVHLHRWGIVHRDIKPENVLFAANGSIKLADFGLAIDMREERPVSRVGTLDYMAPEVLRCPIKQSMAMAPGPNTPAKYGFATDVWAVGIVTYELLTGLPPYAADCRYQAESRICAALPPLFPHYVSPMARDFILRLLAPHPSDRPTMRQVMEHPWIANPEAGYLSAQSWPHLHRGLLSVVQPVPCPEPRPQSPQTPVSHSDISGAQQPFPGSCTATGQQYPYGAPNRIDQPATAALDSAQQALAAAAVALLPQASCSSDGLPSSPHIASHASSFSAPCHTASLGPAAPAAPARVCGSARDGGSGSPPVSAREILALQEQRMLDLSNLPLEQIQGMIQKLQQAMHLAVGKQQQSFQQQGAISSPAAAAAAAATSAASWSESLVATPNHGSGHTPRAAGSDDVHMADNRTERLVTYGTGAPEFCNRISAVTSPVASVSPATCGVDCCLQSSCNSPVVPSPPSPAQNHNNHYHGSPQTWPQALPPARHRLTVGGMCPSNTVATAARSICTSDCGLIRGGSPTATAVAQLSSTPVDMPASLPAARGHYQDCHGCSPVGQPVPTSTGLPWQQLPQGSTKMQPPSPPGYVAIPTPPPGSPRGMSMGLFFGRSSGGGAPEGDGLVYVSIGSSRKGGPIARCEFGIVGPAGSNMPTWMN